MEGFSFFFYYKQCTKKDYDTDQLLQSVMPAVISAATGSKDRQELETMAGQATQVQRQRQRQ